MRKILALLFASQILISCSVYQASTGDRKRDLNVLAPGSSRDIVLAELGTPASSIDNLSTAPANTNSAGQDKSRYDIFSFVQGRSKGANVGRSLFLWNCGSVYVGFVRGRDCAIGACCR